ncbi:monocarboxylate transporter 13 isoform X2 [Ceratitis capitata]|uniref:monocarboxylate transporter 13 isoform X2 n=1 Tax=Ceratitis capitata TaxID=7213 RepID=UPI00032A2D10|nr:monocarboxylate transporter 13 isoform X2 [Ceratitis capitata]
MEMIEIMAREDVSVTKKQNSNVDSNKLKVNGATESCDKAVSLLDSKPNVDSSEYDLVPPDGGWGWLVLLGSMMVNILIPGTIKSFGVLFVEFLEAFDASPATGAWIPALCYFLYSSLGPVSSILSVKYSYRTVTIMGGASAAFGMIASFWASSVAYLYLSYGVLVGIGAGLSFPPTVYIVTSYFVRLRGLANGLCISGSALGSIILPPVLRWLLETYGYRGAVLIMGGITLNVFVAAIFYEPVEQHMIRVPKNKNALEDIEEEDIGIVMKFETVDEAGSINNDVQSHDGSEIGTKQFPSYSPPALLPDNQFVRSASAAVVQNCGKHLDEYTPTSRTRKISTPVRLPQRNQTFTPGQLNSQSSLYAVPEGGRSSHKLDRLSALRNNSKNRLSRRSPSTSSFQYISTPYHGSTLSFQPKEFSSHLSLRSMTSNTGPAANESLMGEASVEDGAEKTSTRSKFFDLGLLKDPTYLVILISNSTNAIGYTNFIILLPAYGVALGFNKSLAAYLISIVSATDLIGRIGGSALSDLGLIPKTWYFIGGLAVSGISLAVLPFATSYGMLSFWCAVFGLASGIYVGITAVIMADMLGEERLTSSYGISLFVNGILQLIGPPICGAWYEAVRDYSPLFHTLGLTLLGGASLWSFMPFINRQKAKEEKLKQAQCDNEAH